MYSIYNIGLLITRSTYDRLVTTNQACKSTTTHISLLMKGRGVQLPLGRLFLHVFYLIWCTLFLVNLSVLVIKALRRPYLILWNIIILILLVSYNNS